MSGTPYLDGDTFDLCHQALRDGRTLEDIAGRLHFDTEYLGRLLQLPTAKPVQVQADASEFDLWRSDELQAQL